MKIWNSYGSEHSANLMMIGRFKDAGSASETMDSIKKLKGYVDDAGDVFERSERYSDDLMKLMQEIGCYDLRPSELDQFRYDISSALNGSEIVITTDETEVSAYLKLLIHKGARIEVYSRHDYPATKKQDVDGSEDGND